MGHPVSSSAGAPSISWCCIGAQKAGTSTLFELLNRHPNLFIPPGKEEPLFHRPYDDAELAEYMARHFPPDEVGARRAGTVTPQYLSSPATADRLHRAFPRARIVVLLRDPVRRAFSHYRMNVRRSIEQRSFSVAVADQVARLTDPAGQEMDPNDESSTYVQRGLYGQLLAPWFELYGDDSVHVAFTEDLEGDPLGTLHDVHRFLGVEPYTSGDEGIRRHADPPRHRFPGLRRRVTGPLRRVGLLDRIPGHLRERLGYRLESALAQVAPAEDPEAAELDDATVGQLRAFYLDDGRTLEKLLGQPPPWPT